MLATILGLISTISKVFLTLVDLFRKSTQEKIDDRNKGIDEQADKAKKEGRPTWKD